MNRRLAILGSYPPPFGGVATHLLRLLPLLDETGIEYCLYNAVSKSARPPNVVSVSEKRTRWLLRYLLVGQESAIYVLSDRLSVWVLAAILGRLRKRKLGLRLRNSALHDYLEHGRLIRMLTSFALRRYDLIVCVNKDLAEAAGKAGAGKAAVVHAPGFLPPSQTCCNPDLVDAEVWRFAESGDPLIVANGKISWHEETDLYGLDMMIRLVADLKVDYPNVRLVVCFWHFDVGTDARRLSDLHEMAGDLGVSDAILLNTKVGVLVPILQRANLFIRPTATDGDANSIREALALGVPAVASDVVERPEGCFVHRAGNQASLNQTVRRVLGETRENRTASAVSIDAATRDTIDRYLASLRDLLGMPTS